MTHPIPPMIMSTTQTQSGMANGRTIHMANTEGISSHRGLREALGPPGVVPMPLTTEDDRTWGGS
jgi:hypothetical protein